MSEYIVRMPPDMPYEIRAELNAWYVESEPIVRCRDCRFFKCVDRDHNGDDWCSRHDHIGWSYNGYCAWAERKEGGDD